MPRAVTPSDPAGRDMGAGLEAHGSRYVERLRAILAALQGQPAPAAAHEVARLARDLWAPESPTKALSTIRRPAPAATVAAVDAALAEGAPWVERPPDRRPNRRDPADGVTVEAMRAVLRARGIEPPPPPSEVIDVH